MRGTFIFATHIKGALAAAQSRWGKREGAKHASFLILGSPGIGKSMSMNYLLMRSLREFPDIPVMTICLRDVDCFVPDRQGSHKRYAANRGDVQRRASLVSFILSVPGVTAAPLDAASRLPLLVLHDIKKQAEVGSHYFGDVMAHLRGLFSLVLAVFSSPNRENYHNYEQETSPTVTKYWMPPWSEEEMKIFFKMQPPSVACKAHGNFQEYWDQAGGIPRSWHLPLDEVARRRADSLGKFRPDPYLNCLPGLSEDAPSLIVAPTCTADHKFKTVEFVSKMAEEAAVRLMGRVSHVVTCTPGPVMQKLKK